MHLNAVTRSAKGTANALIQITFDTALSHDLICTPSQLLFSTDKNKWVSAYLLTSGACLFSRAGPIAIKSIHVISGSPSAIYTIETENTHTFFAGHYGILAHNMLIPEITFSLAASFGTGATVGATTASFLGPIVCSCSIAIGGLIGIAASIASSYKSSYRVHFDASKIITTIQENNQKQREKNNQPLQSSGDNAQIPDPDDENNKNNIIKVENMDEFFKTPFGKEIRPHLEKIRGKSAYRVTKKSKIHELKKGDILYLDKLHKDHLEVFHKNNHFEKVLNLNGTYNKIKTIKGYGRRYDQ